ncbi:MAG: hypothetical protein P8141_14780 [Gammaproteobacteria bacterium]
MALIALARLVCVPWRSQYQAGRVSVAALSVTAELLSMSSWPWVQVE